MQLEALAFEHDIISLQKLCEEKDVTIKELSTLIQSSEVSGSKVTTFYAVLAVKTFEVSL